MIAFAAEVPMKLHTLTKLAFAAVVSIVTACSGQNDTSTNCVPGETQSCVCPNGQNGAQTCGASGAAWEDCVCAGSSGVGGMGQGGSGNGGAGGIGGSGMSGTSSSSSSGLGGDAGSGGAPFGCDIGPSPDGFNCIEGCGDTQYVDNDWALCHRQCLTGAGSYPFVINTGVSQDITFQFPPMPQLGDPVCGPACQFKTGALWSYLFELYGAKGCVKMTTSAPSAGFTPYAGDKNTVDMCGAIDPPSCLTLDDGDFWNRYVAFTAAVASPDPFWIRIQTSGNSCAWQGDPMTCP